MTLSSQRNQDATVYIGGLDDQVRDFCEHNKTTHLPLVFVVRIV